MTWADQLGTDLNDKGAAVALDGAGNFYSPASRDGSIGTKVGGCDVVLVKYAADTSREWVRQFGTTEDDGADIFAEANLYLATGGELDLRLRALRRRHGVQRVGGDRRRLPRQVRCARRERIGREWGGVR